MQFSSSVTARTYSDRAADKTWNDWALKHLHPVGKDVVDIGCGGGIYSYGFAALGARSVVGLDKSPQYLAEAAAGLPQTSAITFRRGDAVHTSLPGNSADIVFERAVVHHLSPTEQLANAVEARRLLRPSGTFAVQDRTIEDVRSTNPNHSLRATLFEVFPRLLEFELARRPSRKRYSELLTSSGFQDVRGLQYEEVRKTHETFEQLRGEISSRKGKSILFELDDAELALYCRRVEEKALEFPLVEQDLWTVWLAVR